jgi:uncharacterized protein (TIGR03435 family)
MITVGAHPMKQTLAAISWMAWSVLAVTAQTSPKARSFEVASVKPAAPDGPAGRMDFLDGSVQEQMHFRGGPGSKSPGRIDYSGVTLTMLLKRAYDVKADQISGPGWLDTERYDIAAKLPRETNAEDLRWMLQELLTERFQIRLHRETKTLPVYLLTVAKNGPKLEPPEKLPEYKDDEERKTAMRMKATAALEAQTRRLRAGDSTTNRSFHLPSATTARFAEVLSSHLDHPVKDKTQLDGLYAFTLNWLADGAKPRNDTPLSPSIFAAVEEQLGLKLQGAKEQIEVLVIDKAEKSPVSN